MHACLLSCLCASVGTVQAQSQDAGAGSSSGSQVVARLLEFDATADSIYALGRLALNRMEYAAAVEHFAHVTRRFPLSYVAPNAWYWYAYTNLQIAESTDFQFGVWEAANAIQTYRMVYRFSHNRSDMHELLERLRASIPRFHRDTRSVASQIQPSVVHDNDVCAGSLGSLPRQLQLLRTLSPEEAADTLDNAIQRGALCGDVSQAAPLYGRLAGLRDSKIIVIAAFGRSQHPSATIHLMDIVRSETLAPLREQAITWLRMRSDPQVATFLKSIGR
jgi:hypothetical protein